MARKAHFPDMLNPAARRWFGMKYKVLLDMGIDGFWNDMNEPAIFYSEKRLNQVLDQAAEFKGKNLDLEKTNQLLGLFSSLANNRRTTAAFTMSPGTPGKGSAMTKYTICTDTI